MRFMIIRKADTETEAGALPTEELVTAMLAYNQTLMDAGIMVDGAGLQRSAKGARMSFSNGKPTVTDGPFAESKELIAGFWLWQVKSKEEATEWLKRAPFDGGTEVELRPVFELDDFGAELTPELREQEERLRGQAAQR